MKKLLNTKEVCGAYNISRSTLWRRIKASQIPSPTIINSRQYWLSDVINDHITEIMGTSL